MKRFSLLLALFACVLSLGITAQPAEATHNVTFSVGRYAGYSNYSTVRAFTFSPTYALQSYAYATYQPSVLAALPPVVQVQRVDPVVTYAAPVDPCPQAVQLFQAAPAYAYSNTYAAGVTYNRFAVGGGYGVSTFRVRNFGVNDHHVSGFRGGVASVNLNVNTGFRVRNFNSVNVNTGFRVRNFNSVNVNNGATVIQNTSVQRVGFFGFGRLVSQSATVINGNGNVQSFQRSRLR